MSPDRQPPSTRTFLLVLGGVLALSCLVCSGGLWVVASQMPLLREGAAETWSDAALTVPQAERLCGVKLVGAVGAPWVRERGFQDPLTDVLVRLRSKEEFLRVNALVPGPPTPDDESEAAEFQVRRVTHPQGGLRASSLEGLADLVTDAGVVLLYRRATLLEFEDQVWVALTAFGT